MSRIHVYMRGANGARNVGFEADGVKILISPDGEEHNDRAMELARAFSATAEALSCASERVRRAEEDRDKARRDASDAISRLPPAKPARLFGPGTVRFGESGALWLLSKREAGWASFGVLLDSWDDLFRRYDVRVTRHGEDEHGPWWEVDAERVAAGRKGGA